MTSVRTGSYIARFFLKWWKRLAWLRSPASAVICRTDTPANPRSAKRRSAASRMASRVELGSRVRAAPSGAVMTRGVHEQTFVCQRRFSTADGVLRAGTSVQRVGPDGERGRGGVRVESRARDEQP